MAHPRLVSPYYQSERDRQACSTGEPGIGSRKERRGRVSNRHLNYLAESRSMNVRGCF